MPSNNHQVFQYIVIAPLIMFFEGRINYVLGIIWERDIKLIILHTNDDLTRRLKFALLWVREIHQEVFLLYI